jgi:hypothetical protein
MTDSRDRVGLPPVRNAWGMPPPSVVRPGYSHAFSPAPAPVGRVRPGYSHAFSPAPAPVGRLQTGHREPSQAPRSAQRVRQPTANSVARFRRMIENPGLKSGELVGILEKEALEMELWFEDHKQKSLRMEIDKKKLEQQIKVDIFTRIHMQDIPMFQQNAELKKENDALRQQMQQIAELKSENDALKTKIQHITECHDNDLMCPITLDLLVDPVVAQDGFSYERNKIEKWFAQCKRSKLIPNSPKTGAPLPGLNLISNTTLRCVIEARH